MRIPINIRTMSLTPRIPGGNDLVQITGEALSGGTIFKFAIPRVQLAEALALGASNGATTPATLTAMEGVEVEPIPQPAEKPEKGVSLRF